MNKSERARRVHVLLESGLGPVIMGHAQLANSLRVAAAQRPAVIVDIAGLPPTPRWLGKLSGPLPLLGRLDLDFQTGRWHLVHSAWGSLELRKAARRDGSDVHVICSHSIGLLVPADGALGPLVLSVDVTVRDWRYMAIWRSPTRYTELSLRPSRALERRALSRAALVHAWTEWAAQGVLREAPNARVFIGHPGIDLERYRPAPRAPRRRPRVLFVGGRFREKGGYDLIEALDPLLGRDVELDIVTPEETLAPRDGLRVHRLTAGDEKLIDLYQQADLFCLPTYGDSTPWVVLEAMACGTPVVATAVGAIPELIGDSGRLVHRGAVFELRRVLADLLGEAGEQSALGEQARDRCKRRYDVRVQGVELLDAITAVGRV